jgi:hypothetical protein
VVFVDFSGQKKKMNAKCFKKVRGKILKSSQMEIYHTAGLDTIFIQIYMDAPPGLCRGPRGVKKSDFFLQTKLLSSCAKITPKRHKLRKIIKIEKKCQKIPVFLEYFELAHLLTPLGPLGGGDPYRRYQGFSICF